MGLRVGWQVVALAVLSYCLGAETCNVRQLNELVHTSLNPAVADNCGAEGSKCVFDRDCCKGLECKMSASEMSIDNYCERTYSKMESAPQGAEGESPGNNQDDGYWMLSDPWHKHEDSDLSGREKTLKNTDALSDIHDLQQNNRQRLQEDNERLKQLFTEKDQEDLELLRAIKEDMELEEFRSLKEMKLKRKLQLLKELRGLKEKKTKDYSNALKNQNNKTSVTDPGVLITNPSQTVFNDSSKVYNRTDQTHDTQSFTTEISESLNENQESEPKPNIDPSQNSEKITESEVSPQNQSHGKNKPGAHGHHHHKSGHQQKHRKKQRGNSTGISN